MDSFVYQWTNKTLNKIYVGFHKGHEDDGYICSSSSTKFWDDFNNPDYIWERTILFRGEMRDCQLKESAILDSLDITSDAIYNQKNNIMFNLDDEVRNKLSEAAQKRNENPEYIKKLSEATKRQWQNPEHRARIKETHTGKKISDETKEKLREANLGKKQSKETISKRVEKLKGHSVTEETRRKISETRKSKSSELAKMYKAMYGFVCPFGEFASITEYLKYARTNNLVGFKDTSKIRALLKDNTNQEWRYINK